MIYRNYIYEIKDKTLLNIINDKDRYNERANGVYNYVLGINRKFEQNYVESEKTMFAFISEVEYFTKKIYLSLAYNASALELKECERIITEFIKSDKKVSSEEITISEFLNRLNRAVNYEHMNSSYRSIREKLGINLDGRQGLYSQNMFEYSEKMYTGKLPSKKETLKKAKEILASKSFLKEIDRIYSSKNTKEFYGHPVHYYITAGNWGAAQDMIDVLIPALLKNKRLLSSRVGTVRKIMPNASNEENFENLFSSANNSAIVVDFSGDKSIRNYATGYQKNAEEIGKKLKEYGNGALFIFVEISENIVYRDEVLASILSNGDIIKIEEGFGNHQEALNYLNDLVKRSPFKQYKEDMNKYLPDKVSFAVSDIFDAYETWYGNGLKTHVYKAYKECESVKIEYKKPEGEPYEKLQELIGLKDIKKVVEQIITFNKVQNYRKEMGLPDNEQCRHMLFYGNPGTAKTTVARLLSQILKEEGVLDNGHLVECGRQDLVARYVGWTAKTVKEKFDAARGGILFIDEAYSLLDDSNSFGDEAINTIVQCMENYRDEVIVVLAGYPDKMKSFVEKNEGLASRIAFQLNFPDYNDQELLGIMELMLKEHNYHMSDEAKERCLKVFKDISKVPNFGNGRFVRNLLEQIELKQSERIFSKLNNQKIDKDKLTLIEAEDMVEDYNFITAKKQNNIIGY